MSALHPTALVFPDIVQLSDNNILDASVIRFWDTSIWSEVNKLWRREREIERELKREIEIEREGERKKEATINHKELSTEIEADKNREIRHKTSIKLVNIKIIEKRK